MWQEEKKILEEERSEAQRVETRKPDEAQVKLTPTHCFGSGSALIRFKTATLDPD